MLNFTENDRAIIQNSYHNFLQSLKSDFQNTDIKSSLDCYAIIVKLLKEGHFSLNGNMKYLSSFDYLNLPYMMDGVQVMYGIGCCRHINSFVNDVMQMLGFNVSLLYVKIDETDTWHRATPLTANHVVVILKDHNSEYLLDAYNNYAFEIVGYDLEPLKLKNFAIPLMAKYPDDNIKEGGLILQKYYKLQELGIDYVYEY